MKNLGIEPLLKSHWDSVSKIYMEGINTGLATFETDIPNWEFWNKKYIKPCRFIAKLNDSIVGFAVLSKVSERKVYKGLAEVSVYVSEKHRGKGIGELLLNSLISESETYGFWTLQAGIFSENKASINLHLKCGFRSIGIREKIGQLNGIWHDNHVLERRSKLINLNMKNILLLCTGNSCRSQMAHGYLKEFALNKAVIYSAGIETHGLNPGAVSIMKKDGIDISSHTSNHVDEYVNIDFDFIITVCDHAHENCPFIPSKNAKRLHHNFFDPSKVTGTQDEIHQAFLKARNEIKEYCKTFVDSELINV